jgi:hypothetical protein
VFSAKIGSLKVVFEYEKYDHKSSDIWIKKKAVALEKCAIVKFVCIMVDARQIVKVVGESYIFKRGVDVNEFIQTLTNQHESQKTR